MQIKSYKDLVGLSIAQARAAYDEGISDLLDAVDMDPVTGKSWRWLHQEASTKIESLTFKIEALVGVIAEVSLKRDIAHAEVERLTKVIASYDTPAELEAAKSFIKAFNIDVKKYETEVAQEVELGRHIIDEDARVFAALAKSEAADRLRIMEPAEKPSTDSLQKVWKAIHGTHRGRSAEVSKWTRRRLTQLNRLEELGYAHKAPSGAWWPRSSGPEDDQT
jgi:hypothetical protein